MYIYHFTKTALHEYLKSLLIDYYSDVIMCNGVSNRRCLHCLLNHLIKENIKAPRHWPLWGESHGARWIPLTKGKQCENVSIWWRHHQLDHRYANRNTWPRLNIKTGFPGVGIYIIKIRRSWDRLIFIIGMLIVVKRHLYIETLSIYLTVVNPQQIGNFIKFVSY